MSHEAYGTIIQAPITAGGTAKITLCLRGMVEGFRWMNAERRANGAIKAIGRKASNGPIIGSLRKYPSNKNTGQVKYIANDERISNIEPLRGMNRWNQLNTPKTRIAMIELAIGVQESRCKKAE